MAKHRTIEETFEAIQPRGRRGIPDAPTISVGAASDGGDFSTALSQAGQQIARLQSAYQQQAALIQANTQAVQGNTSAQNNRSAGSVAGGVASDLLGGFGLGLLSPLISGIAGLFEGGSSAPAALPIYVPPSPVSINAPLYSAPSGSASTSSGSSTTVASNQAAPQVTVNVSAMDSQSFLDHSADIANAVREAMLNMHPLNDVVASM